MNRSNYSTHDLVLRSKKRNIFKVLIAGEGGVGKTTLLYRYKEGFFTENTKVTIGVDFCVKKININNEDCELQIWDYGGQKRFRDFLESYAMGASGALLAFDLTHPDSINNFDEWEQILKSGKEDLPILLIGTKYDLFDSIKISDEFAHKLKEVYNCIDFIKVSSKTGFNVKKCFARLAEIMLISSQSAVDKAKKRPVIIS